MAVTRVIGNMTIHFLGDNAEQLATLSEVPYHFLDRHSWNDILSFAGGRQTALELLDAPNPDASPEFWDSAVPGSRLQDRRRRERQAECSEVATPSRPALHGDQRRGSRSCNERFTGMWFNRRRTNY